MSPDRDRRVEAIFDRAVDLSGTERSAYLDRECGADQGLRQAVESLLDAYDRSPSYFERPVAAPVLGLMQQGRSRSWIGRQVGPFEIRDPIGDGGMGSVFLAEQQAPVRRRVALKVMNATFASEQMVRRFEAERQALALMNHPYIAQVYESGSTDDGEPWVAMEYVEGVALNDYCDDRRLSLRQRLELFLKVCGGVQHAHRKGIIHRDLKPSNVLVSGEGESAMPKIIDFGIAKAIDQRLVDATLATGHWLMGTPSYMSPERFGPEGDVDTRADVYSLGVMLYELLVGELPFEREAADVLEIAAKIGSDEAERPSSRVTTVPAERLGTLADHRSTDAAGLARALEGDLDWICLKAMEADRERRYESASELAADIRRHLRDEPVVARPPSAAYRIGKYVRRHTVAVIAATAVVVAVVAGVTGIALQSHRANREAKRAIEAGARASEQQLRAEQVSQFLVELFEVSDPSEAKGNTVTAREILDRGADKIETELADEPEVQATLINTISAVYENLGLYERAQELAEQGLRIRRQVFGDRHPDVASSLSTLATVLRSRGEYAEAERLHREELSMRRQLLGAKHPEVLDTLNNLSLVLADVGEFEEAEELLREVLEARRSTGTGGEELLETSINNLALVLQRRGSYDEAEELQREALQMTLRLYGDDHPYTTIRINNLSTTLMTKGEYAEAEELQREALALRRRFLGDDHPDVATCLNNLSTVLMDQGAFEEAEPLQREAIAIQRAALGDDHPHVANGLTNLTIIVTRLGDHEEAATLGREALEAARRAFTGTHPLVGRCLLNLGTAVEALGDYEEAESLYRESVVVFRESLGDDHFMVAAALNNIGVLMFRQERYEEAERVQRDALDTFRRALGDTHPYAAMGLFNLAGALEKRHRFAEAERAYRESLTIRREVLPRGDLSVSDSLVGVGSVLIQRGDAVAAEPLLREALDIRRSALPEDDWRIAHAQSILGGCMAAQGRFDEAEPLLLDGYSSLEGFREQRPAEAGSAVGRLVDLYERWDRSDRAEHYRALQTHSDTRSEAP